MRAIFGRVSAVRDFIGLQVCRVTIEIPIEFHVNATNAVYGKDVLVTLAPPSMKGGAYGIVEATSATTHAKTPVAEDDAPLKGGQLSQLAARWGKSPVFQRWARDTFPEVAKALPSEAFGEGVCRDIILTVCRINSRKELDSNSDAAARFQDEIRAPFMAAHAPSRAGIDG